MQATIAEFGKTVEDHCFRPRTVAELQSKSGRGRAFGQDVGGNCDGRFSCSAYRAYGRASGYRQETQLRAVLEQPDEQDRIDRLDAALQADT